VNDSGKSNSPYYPTNKRSSRENPEAEGLLSLLKDMNLLQQAAEKKGYEFLSYLLHMAILEAQSLASGGERDQDSASRDQREP